MTTDSESLFDQSAALSNVGGNIAILQEIIGVYFEECPGWLTQIHDGLATGEVNTVRRAAHCLKGSLSIFGPNRARIVAQQLETMIQAQNLSGAEEVARQLENALNELRPALEAVA